MGKNVAESKKRALRGLLWQPQGSQMKEGTGMGSARGGSTTSTTDDRTISRLSGRQMGVVNRPAQWRFPEIKFIYEKKVFLKHTNMEGNTYYDNYVAWHGEAREALLLSHPQARELMNSRNAVKMITHSLYQCYIRDTFFGDTIQIEVTSKEIKRCSFVLVFRYYNKQTAAVVGEGWQKICFGDPKTGKICRIPELILDLIEPIQE